MLLENVKVVGCLAPVDSNGAAKNGQAVGVGKYQRVTLLVYIGNLAGDITLTIEECATAAGGSNVARAFNYYKAATGAAAKSVLDGARTAATSAGITIANATDDNKIIAIDVDGAELTDGKPYVRVATSDPSAAGLLAFVALLSDARYKGTPANMPDPTS